MATIADSGVEPVEALYRSLLAGWNARDATAFAANLAEDAIVIGFDGSPMHGRRAAEESIAPIFAAHPTAAYVGIVRTVTFLTPDVAILHAVGGLVPPGGSEIIPEANAQQIMVAKHGLGSWVIAAYQNTPAAFHGRPELSTALTRELQAEYERRGLG